MLMLRRRWKTVESWVKRPRRVGSGRMKRKRWEEEEIVELDASQILLHLHSPSRSRPTKLISHPSYLPS